MSFCSSRVVILEAYRRCPDGIGGMGGAPGVEVGEDFRASARKWRAPGPTFNRCGEYESLHRRRAEILQPPDASSDGGPARVGEPRTKSDRP